METSPFKLAVLVYAGDIVTLFEVDAGSLSFESSPGCWWCIKICVSTVVSSTCRLLNSCPSCLNVWCVLKKPCETDRPQSLGVQTEVLFLISKWAVDLFWLWLASQVEKFCFCLSAIQTSWLVYCLPVAVSLTENEGGGDSGKGGGMGYSSSERKIND